MNKFLTTFQAIHYLLSETGKKDKLSIIKLLFLSDKYQLVHIGRTITDGDYFAMRAGPVSSQAKYVLDSIEGIPSEHNKVGIDVSAIVVENGKFAVAKPQQYEELSDSDRKAIKYVASTFGQKGYKDLIEYLHNYPEWKKHKKYFEKNNGRKRIKETEMFSVIDDSLDITAEEADNTKDLIYNN